MGIRSECDWRLQTQEGQGCSVFPNAEPAVNDQMVELDLDVIRLRAVENVFTADNAGRLCAKIIGELARRSARRI